MSVTAGGVNPDRSNGTFRLVTSCNECGTELPGRQLNVMVDVETGGLTTCCDPCMWLAVKLLGNGGNITAANQNPTGHPVSGSPATTQQEAIRFD